MSQLSDSNREVIEKLKERYKSLSLYAKWFFPPNAHAALLSYQSGSEDESIKALALCKAFLNETWFTQRLFFSFFDSCLEEFSSSSLIIAARELNEAGLLTGDVGQANFNAVTGHQNPLAVASALRALDAEALLTEDVGQANRDAVTGNQDPSAVASALLALNDAGLLTEDRGQANRDAVARHQNPVGVALALRALDAEASLTGDAAKAIRDTVVGNQEPLEVANVLVILNRVGLLTGDRGQAICDAVAGHRDKNGVASALVAFNEKGLLAGNAAQANCDAVVGHREPCQVARALLKLNTTGLLTGDAARANRDAVAGHREPLGIAEALIKLNEAGLLTGDAGQANRDAVTGADIGLDWCPSWVALVLVILNRVGLLTGDRGQANRAAVAGHRNPYCLADTLAALNEAGLLTGDVGQANFNALMMHSAILFHAEMPEFWNRIPRHLFTQARFAALIEICQRHADNPAAGRALVIAYINREILGINEPAAGGPRLNAGQSTHTASVHQSVSESATRLLKRYGAQISGRGLNETIQALSTWLNAQPDSSLEVRKAKCCLERLITSDSFYTDPRSRVSMKQLLALFWIAIHDDACRQGTLDDAKLQLIDGLYQSQREYNLSATGEDNRHEVDEPSCLPGTFNKMIEKGQGVHPDMVIDFISMAGFSLKIPLVVSEEAMAYLKSRDILNLRSLIEAIYAEDNANSVGPIWAEIRAVVEERMFNEFGALFGNDRRTLGFLNAIAAGEFCSLNPNHLSELDQLIEQRSQDGGAAAANLSTATDSFFSAAASPETNDNTRSAPEAPHP
jgi:hypothetical protein